MRLEHLLSLFTFVLQVMEADRSGEPNRLGLCLTFFSLLTQLLEQPLKQFFLVVKDFDDWRISLDVAEDDVLTSRIGGISGFKQGHHAELNVILIEYSDLSVVVYIDFIVRWVISIANQVAQQLSVELSILVTCLHGRL